MKALSSPPANPSYRIAMANRALDCFASGTLIFHLPRTGFHVQWLDSRGEHSRRWSTRGQDFYPVWHRQWGHGGTATTALANLIRWCAGRPCLPLTTWEYWMGKTCHLGRDRGEECVNHLRIAGYPEIANCVLCGDPILRGMDWWSLKGVTGPCCSMRSGCRQDGVSASKMAGAYI